MTRYLKGTRHFVNKLELDGDVDKHVARLDGFSDSAWAGSTDRKSQSSGVLFVDRAPLYSFSRRESVIATSSGMAEFYAGCATAEEMLLARDVLMFFGCPVEASLHMDSAAARGICRREGVGKVKSLEVRTLWLQQVVKAKTLTLKTVKSQDNCADLGTKTGCWDTQFTQKLEWTRMPWTVFPAEFKRLRFLLVNLGRSEREAWTSRNSCMLCVRTRSMVGTGGSHHDVGVETVVESLVVHAHLPRLLSCLSYYSD